jgi:hypothetical protein
LTLLAGFAATGLALMQPCRADTPADAIAHAQADFDRGRGGDTAALDRAADAFKDLSMKDPANPLLLAYFGAATTLQAKNAWAPWNKMKYAEGGLGSLDKALALLQPDDDRRVVGGLPVGLGTRMLAVTTFLSVPDMFHRFETGKDVLRQALAAPAFPSAAPALRAQLVMQSALVAQKEDRRDAELAQLKQVVALAPGTPVAQRAATRLKELGQ